MKPDIRTKSFFKSDQDYRPTSNIHYKTDT